MSIGQCYTDGLVQDCSKSIANALELLQSCTKPSIQGFHIHLKEILLMKGLQVSISK